MRWIDTPDWSDPTGQAIRRILVGVLWQKAELQAVWQDAGLIPGELDWSGSAAQIWPAMLRDATTAAKLEALFEAVKARSHAVATQLDALLFAQAVPTHWYRSADRFSRRLLGPGSRRALIDRHALSHRLREIVEEGYLVFSIRGGPGTGKSYSRYLIQHVAQDPALSCRLVVLDIAQEWPQQRETEDVGSIEFARYLAQKVGMRDDAFDVDPHTERTRIGREVARMFVARFRDLPPGTRWLFVDGLDRAFLRADVAVFIGHLAHAADTGELGDTRLILTGYSGEFCQSVSEMLREEEIEPMREEHVIRFFEEIGEHIDRSLDDGEAEELAARALRGVSPADLPALGATVSALAHERFETS